MAIRNGRTRLLVELNGYPARSKVTVDCPEHHLDPDGFVKTYVAMIKIIGPDGQETYAGSSDLESNERTP